MIRFLFIFFTAFVFQTSLGQSFEEKVTNASNVRLSVTNVGTFGNAFRGYRDNTGTQSCEYPAGSGIEHLFESGVWFGGIVNGEKLVSTSAYDAPQGYAAGNAGFEMTAEIGARLTERSSLFDNPNFSTKAVSHQDFVADFTDKNFQIPGTQININSHTKPLEVDVHMETYNWNYSFSDFFVILNFSISNNSASVIEEPYFALWANTVVRNLNITAAGAGGASFYDKGGNGFMDSLSMAYCYDAAGDVEFTKSYIGQKFLGASDKRGFRHPDIDTMSISGDIDSSFKVHYNSWQFNNTTNPVFFLPSTDDQRYKKMSEGLNFEDCWTSLNQACATQTFQEQLNAPGNRSDLVSVGPFTNMQPGDEINVAYAFILAKKKDDGAPNLDNTRYHRTNLIDNAAWAQTAFNGEDKNFNGRLDKDEDKDENGEITRYILPTPPDIPKTKIIADTNRLDIYWSNNSEESIDPITNKKDFEGYRVYMTKLGFDVTKVPNLSEDLVLVAEYDKIGNKIFNETGFESIKLQEPKIIEDDTFFYKFSIENVLNGWQYAIAVSAFDEGNPESNLEPLESSVLSNNFRTFTGTVPNSDISKNEPFVYPNPYYAGAAWEGLSTFSEESRKIIFANLPMNCIVRIFSPAGDFIDEINHNGDYTGSDIRWYETFGSEDQSENVFSGGEHAWDLLSENSQIISRGIYLFSVEDLDTGKKYKGKFAIIK